MFTILFGYRKEVGNIKKVKELRVRRNYSQIDLASLTGVARQTFGFIEKGEIPPPVALALKLAHHLQVTVDQLFWLEEEDN